MVVLPWKNISTLLCRWYHSLGWNAPTGTSHVSPCSSFLHYEVVCTPKGQKLYNSLILYNLIEQKRWSARENLYKYTKIAWKITCYCTIVKHNNVAKRCERNIVNYHIIFELWSHVDTKQSVARCARVTIKAGAYLSRCHSCKFHRGKSIIFRRQS
jgi:hypothetical protein